MTFKIRSHHHKKDYFQKQEAEHFVAKKHKTPLSYLREADRMIFHIPQRVRQVGESVEYRNHIGEVERVTNEGVYVRLYDLNIEHPHKLKKLYFVSNKSIEEGKIYPEELGVSGMEGYIGFTLPHPHNPKIKRKPFIN